MHFVALGPVFRGEYYHFFARPPPLELLVCVCVWGPIFLLTTSWHADTLTIIRELNGPPQARFFFSATALLPSPASFALSDLQHDFIRGFYFPLL